MAGPIDKEKVQFNLARQKKNGKTFEVAIDPDQYMLWKQDHSQVDMDEIVRSEHIFSDVKRGQLASVKDVEAEYGTSDILVAAEEIIKNGQIQLHGDWRAKVRDQKLNKLINMIHSMCVDPKTKAPHPVKRIELAFDEAKIAFNDSKPAEHEFESVVKKLRPILPLSIYKTDLDITIPATYVGKVKAHLQKTPALQIREEVFGNDGSLIAAITIPGGLSDEVVNAINAFTDGEAEIRINEDAKNFV